MQQDEHYAENRHHTKEESGLSRYVNLGQILWMYAMYLLHMGQGLDGGQSIDYYIIRGSGRNTGKYCRHRS
jgi:hypothetical protein